jgi:hypothetical protein
MMERRLQMKKFLLPAFLGLAVVFAGCKEDDVVQTGGSRSGPSGSSAAPAVTQPGAGASEEDHHDHIPIGEQTVGGFKLVAAAEAPVKPGGEGGFDLVITGGKPNAVRFWVGTEDARGSVKAKAEEETAGTWHGHTEVPDPLPPGSKFWAEIEPPTGEKFSVSFDLKTE